MKLNFLEFLGVMMIVLIVFVAILCLYYLIKDTINKWKEKYRNECPFCGAYLHGYQNIHMGAKHDARYCSRCGRYLNEAENIFDPIKFRKELRSQLLCSNTYRERVKKLGCESCIYFRKQCDAMTGILAPEIFENECKHRRVVLRKEKSNED